MSLTQVWRMEVESEKEEELGTILEGEGVRYEGRLVIVNGKEERNLDALVPEHSRIVVVSPVAGG